MYIFFPPSLAGKLLNQQEVQGGEFIRSSKTVFTRTSLRILLRASYCGKNLGREREINRVLEREYAEGEARGQNLIEDRCVLSGRERFIRYFSRDLSTHSLILLRPARLLCRAEKLLFFFFNRLQTIFFSHHPLCYRWRFFSRVCDKSKS